MTMEANPPMLLCTARDFTSPHTGVMSCPIESTGVCGASTMHAGSEPDREMHPRLRRSQSPHLCFRCLRSTAVKSTTSTTARKHDPRLKASIAESLSHSNWKSSTADLGSRCEVAGDEESSALRVPGGGVEIFTGDDCVVDLGRLCNPATSRQLACDKVCFTCPRSCSSHASSALLPTFHRLFFESPPVISSSDQTVTRLPSVSGNT